MNLMNTQILQHKTKMHIYTKGSILKLPSEMSNAARLQFLQSRTVRWALLMTKALTRPCVVIMKDGALVPL